MGFPVVTCEVAFGIDPLSAPGPGDWTDISAFVRGFSTRRGRQTELDKVEAGTAQITLDNSDRRFEPEHAGSPYFPDVRPMAHVRIRASIDATTYDIYRGFVESWVPSYLGPPGSGSAEVTVGCVDAFKVLALAKLSAYRTKIAALNPVAYWPLDEVSGTSATDITTSPANGTYTNGPVLAGAQGPWAAAGPAAPDFDGTNDHVDIGGPTKVRDALKGSHSVAFWIWVDAVAGGVDMFVYADPPVDTHVFESTPGNYRVIYKLFAPDDFLTLGWTGFTLGACHLFVGTWDRSSGSGKLWIDAVLREAASNSAMAGADLDVAGFDTAFMTFPGNPSSFACNGRIAHVAIFNHVLTETEITDLYSSEADALQPAPSGDLVDAILDAIEWPATERAIDAGSSTLQGVTLEGNALELLRVIETSEQGLLYVGADGRIGFHQRHAIAQAPHNTNAATFGDGGGAEIVYESAGATFSFDDENIWNVVEVTPVGLATQRRTDEPSRQAYGTRVLERGELLLRTAAEAADTADFLLSRFAEPELRLRELRVAAHGTDLAWPQVLGRDIHFDRVEVRKTPPGGGAAIAKDVHIAGMSHDVGPQRWVTRFSLTPADPLTYWLLGDTTYGVLDSTTRLGY